MEKKITPTLTLAQLYEAQKQYFDAFTLYSILYRANPNDEILVKKRSVEKKIFTDQSLEYNKLINQIFTAEDKEKFRLLPESNFQNFKSAMEQDYFEPIVFQEEEFDEPPEEDNEKEEVDIEDSYFGKKPKIADVTYIDDLIYDDIIDLTALKNEELREKATKTISSTQINLPQISSDSDDLLDMTISAFSSHLIKKIGSDKKISDLTLKEIKEIKSVFKDFL
ncbi:MAG: hypothetical protein FWG98_07195 [Candidatus Cloacimonetes bacterium]|nr:hypothetical protein [Candidatus Cloacimonadota bacterium]